MGILLFCDLALHILVWAGLEVGWGWIEIRIEFIDLYMIFSKYGLIDATAAAGAIYLPFIRNSPSA